MNRLLIIAVLLLTTLAATAQDKPRWAIKGVADINAQRTNQTYNFVKFETFGGDLDALRNESTRPLVEYLSTTFGLSDDNASVEQLPSASPAERTLPNDPDATPSIARDYKVTFSGPRPAIYYARLIDEYVSFDDNVDETYDYTLYQLFEVSNREDGIMPDYDDCDFTRSRNGQALVRSIIPGLGQYYKGQHLKAYCIWGGEAVFIAAALICEKRRSDYAADRNRFLAEGDLASWDSYRSKSQSWRTFRNIAIGGAIGVYVYNLLDAALSKGPRQVIVRKGTQPAASLTFAPTLIADPSASLTPALGLAINF